MIELPFFTKNGYKFRVLINFRKFAASLRPLLVKTVKLIQEYADSF